MLQCLWLEAGILEGVNLCISCGSVPKYLQQIMQDNCDFSWVMLGIIWTRNGSEQKCYSNSFGSEAKMNFFSLTVIQTLSFASGSNNQTRRHKLKLVQFSVDLIGIVVRKKVYWREDRQFVRTERSCQKEKLN